MEVSATMKRQGQWQLWAALAAIGLLAYGAFSLRGAMQPYVTFDQAKRLTGTVRVAVFVNHQTRRYDHETGAMEFEAKDTKGNRCLVRLNPNFVPPGGFEQTPMAVVIGRYRDGVFEADRLFIKCPSKYEGHPETGKGK
jgi:cytochrome c-type biogenesis protein CcmE